MRVKGSTDTGLLTERQWAKQGFLRNPDAVGVTLWTNRHCQHTALYLTEKEVHKAAPDELAAYWLPERQKRAKRRRELAAEKTLQAERERLAMESLIDRLHDRISRLEEIAKSLFRQIPVDAPISAEEIVMDIETTGLECGYDEILQISILSGAGETLYHSYIRPIHAEDWQEAERINHITPDMVADAPSIYEEMPKINAILRDAKRIIGYNHTGFDVHFLEHFGAVFPEDAEMVDVMLEFAPIYGEYNECYGEYKWQKLSTCAAYYGYDWGEDTMHDSLADCKATLHCYRSMNGKS